MDKVQTFVWATICSSVLQRVTGETPPALDVSCLLGARCPRTSISKSIITAIIIICLQWDLKKKVLPVDQYLQLYSETLELK